MEKGGVKLSSTKNEASHKSFPGSYFFWFATVQYEDMGFFYLWKISILTMLFAEF